jgi:hypothetical protein
VKAIVLTFDRNRAVTDHMIFKYAEVWPNHPFHFRVPYQQLAPTMAPDVVEYRKSPEAIKATVLTLLEDLGDEEIVYWCIDDKYPINFKVQAIEGIHGWLAKVAPAEVSGVLFCRCRAMLNDRYLTGRIIVDDSGRTYLERNGYEQIWIHQFLRVKVLRHLFESFPDEIPIARALDQLKTQVVKPPTHRIYVSSPNLAVFGESTLHGALTPNCHSSILQSGLALPPWFTHTTPNEVVMGALDS